MYLSYLVLENAVVQMICRTYLCNFYAFVYRYRGKNLQVRKTCLETSPMICFYCPRVYLLYCAREKNILPSGKFDYVTLGSFYNLIQNCKIYRFSSTEYYLMLQEELNSDFQCISVHMYNKQLQNEIFSLENNIVFLG